MAPLASSLEVFYDGACPFCVASMERMRKLDTVHRINFLDLNDPAAASPRFTSADLIAEMHAKLPDGTWRIGFAAWAAIIAELPGLRWLGAAMTLPVISDIGRLVYRKFAANRYLVSKVLRLPAPCDANGACRIPVAPLA